MNIAAAMEKALKALDTAKHGLMWYAGRHPEDVDENDEAAESEINEAISSLSEAIAAVEERKPVAGLLGTKVNFGAPDARDIENGWEPLYLAAGAQTIPTGYRLVPIDPTPEMKSAAIGVEVYSDSPVELGALTWHEASSIYKAMLVAAPVQAQERDEEIERMKVKETDWAAAYQAAYQEATRATVHASQLDTKLTTQHELLKKALEALQQLFPQNGNEGGVAVWRLGASHSVRETILSIQEQVK
jgi:hypothetical protein